MHTHVAPTTTSALPETEGFDSGVPAPDTVVVGTYPPTLCGLATFTANTRACLLDVDDRREVRVLRLGSPPGGRETVPEVCATWPRGSSAAAAAAACSGFDVVLAQHEFGIYDGDDGCHVLDFADLLERPLVTVLHTIVVEPTPSQRTIIETLAAASARVIVLSQAAADRLLTRYEVDPEVVRTVPHGAQLNLGPAPPPVPGPPTLLTWGLLGPGKGIEHGIRAVALLARRGMPVRYVVAGQTHPNVLRDQGERYRDSLRRLAHHLDVDSLVEFDDGYSDWRGLYARVRAADIVLLPYDSREQVTSGVLVEALASGKAIVATAFPHALEVVADKTGIVVPHEDPHAIAAAVQRMVQHPRLRHQYEAAARHEGLRHSWPTVGRGYEAILREAVSLRAGDAPRR